ncbi:MAG TPA: CHASE3 domain-containing protein [Rhizomicrobium sp.]|nr:CHASE3 domain-containing protein [Rhizomicrobium sp.]
MIPLVVVTAVISYFSVQFAAEERIEQGWVVHTYQVIDTLKDVLSDAQNAETGQRGYIITREQKFLAPYRAGVRRARANLQNLRGLTRDNPLQHARAEKLALLLDARIKALDASIAFTVQALKSSPELLAAMDLGRTRMDSLRVELARAIAEENRLLKSRIESRHVAERKEIIAASSAAFVALLVLLSTAVLLLRSNARLVESERELENESAILQTTLDTIRDGIAMFASNGDLCVFNAQFFGLLAIPTEFAHKGARLTDIRAAVQEAVRPLLDEGRAEEWEQGYRRVSMSARELDVYRSPVPTGGVVVAVVDVTARVEAELVARQAQKMEAVGHLTGGVAHDFNNILQVIGANLERVVRERALSPEAAERIQSALDAVANGAKLTSQLLAFARRQPLDPRSTNVGRTIQDMTELLRRTLGESIEVECVVAGGLWNTLIDPSQIESAILNLSINARDAMPNGGKLTLEVANAFLDDAYAAQHAEVSPGQYVMIAVSDTGVGMSDDTVARAFEPFFTTKPEGRGTGLGLSQVYGFVKQSGGHIKIYSEIGQGTTIKLYLPRTRKPQEGMSPVLTGAPLGRSECILVVEDDESVRSAVVDMVSELGYKVLKADNADQALTILSSGVRIDLLFTDVVMPGAINARELARRACELHPHISVLYTSGYTRNAIVHNGKLDDDVFLLSKPYRRDELASKLRRLLDKRPGSVSPVDLPIVATPPASGKVLVVEDIGLIRMTTVEMLEELGFKTVEAATGEDALTILQNDREINILLTDLGLPGMDGRKLAQEALRLNANLKVVIASGYSSEHGTEDLPPGSSQLMKPFDIEQLKRALES